jgi:hypothetical protein
MGKRRAKEVVETPKKEVAMVAVQKPSDYKAYNIWEQIEQTHRDNVEDGIEIAKQIRAILRSSEPPDLKSLYAIASALKINGEALRDWIEQSRKYNFWGTISNVEDQIQAEKLRQIAKRDLQIESEPELITN